MEGATGDEVFISPVNQSWKTNNTLLTTSLVSTQPSVAISRLARGVVLFVDDCGQLTHIYARETVRRARGTSLTSHRLNSI